MENNVIETRTAKIWLDEDDFIRYRIFPGVEVTLEDCREYVAAQNRLTGGRRVLNLTDIRDVKSIDRDAREFLGGGEAAEITLACALIVGSPVSRVVGNFMLGFNRPFYPLELFTSETKAVRWLGGFLD